MNSRLQTQLLRAAQVVADSEKFLVGVLAVRAEKFAQAQPYDPCAVGMANFLKKKAAGPNALISRSELKQVYGKLYAQNSLFAEEFAEELGVTAEFLAPKKSNRSPLEGTNLLSEALDKSADPILKAGLDSAFDSSLPYKTYSAATAISAEKSCFHELNRQGLPPREINVVAGQVDLLLCRANYETPKGLASVLIPVEIRESKALLPTIFLTAEGCLDLNAVDLEAHLVSSAGKTYQVDTQKVLKVLSSAKNPVQPLSDLQKMVMRVNAKKEVPATQFENSIFQEIDKKAEYFKLPEQELPTELKSISDSLVSQAGQAEFLFSKKSVETGTQLVRQILSDLGHKSVQIRVASVRAEGPVYAASLDSRTALKIPVKMSKSSVIPPGMCLVAGKVFSLNADGLKLAQQETPALEVQASASANFDLKSGQLIDQLKIAMLSENYLKAEDILNVLEQRGDLKALGSAQQIYKAGLKGELLPELSKCAASYISSVSTQRICFHTNLPVDKVYQDSYGNCHPKYRQGMAESFDGASLIDHKVYL